MTDLSSHDLSQEQVQHIVDSLSIRKARSPKSLKVLSLEIAQYLVDTSAPEDFPIELHRVFQWIDFNREAIATILVGNFEQEIDYKVESDGALSLSIDCFKAITMMIGTEEAKTARKYFIEAEKIARKRPPLARQALLRVLYDTAISKCINYVHAEYAMNQFFCYQGLLEPISKYTMQVFLMVATQTLEDVEDGSLQWAACANIIKEQFLRVRKNYESLEEDCPKEEPFTIVDLEDIEFIVYKHYF
jgi:hypothetical protein